MQICHLLEMRTFYFNILLHLPSFGYCIMNKFHGSHLSHLVLIVIVNYYDNIFFYLPFRSTDQSNSSVEKAGILGSMPMRLLKADDQGRMTGATLAKAVAEDIANGLIPCYVVATLGTTGTCAFDCLEELGPICNKNDIWLHVDAAYAGT